MPSSKAAKTTSANISTLSTVAELLPALSLHPYNWPKIWIFASAVNQGEWQ